MVVVSFVFSGSSGFIERIFLDKFMVGKFSVEMVFDGKGDYFVFIYYNFICNEM